MDISSADFCKLSLQEVADMLLDDLSVNDKRGAGAVCHGVDDTGRMYSLYVKLELFRDGE